MYTVLIYAQKLLDVLSLRRLVIPVCTFRDCCFHTSRSVCGVLACHLKYLHHPNFELTGCHRPVPSGQALLVRLKVVLPTIKKKSDNTRHHTKLSCLATSPHLAQAQWTPKQIPLVSLHRIGAPAAAQLLRSQSCAQTRDAFCH